MFTPVSNKSRCIYHGNDVGEVAAITVPRHKQVLPDDVQCFQYNTASTNNGFNV